MREAPVAALLVLVLALSCCGAASQARRPAKAKRCTTGTAFDKPIKRLIRRVWGQHGPKAIRIAQCESGHLGTRARNGQYRGLFQMSRRARRRYGHGDCAEAQARAAYRYFVRVGKRWWPWSCRKKLD